MSDISLPWGGDVQPDETGDILCVDGAAEISQRIVRRILTNPYISDLSGGVKSDADYVFHPDYGGGVRAYVDAPNTTANATAIKNRIRDQLRYESGVDLTKEPTININQTQDSLIVSGVVATPNGQILPIPQMEIKK